MRTWVDRMVASLAIGTVSCAVEPISGGDESSMGHGQFSQTMGIWVATPVTWVLVVDDAPSYQARTLREELARDVVGVFDRIDSAGAGIDPDPGVFRPIDYRIVVVGASGTLPPLHIEHDPELAVQADNAIPEVQSRWEEAVGRAILSTETAQTEPLLAIEVANRWRGFLTGEEDPASEVDLRYSCMPSRPLVDAEGRAACRLYGYVPLGEPCPEELGWVDPMDADGVRRQRLGIPDFDSEFWRLCELPQLEGSALRSCREDFTCDDCKPGWCFRRQWTEEDLSREVKVRNFTFSTYSETWCEDNLQKPSFSRLRIVHEAGTRSMRVKLTCNTDPGATEPAVPGIP